MIETLDDVVESLADQIGVYGAHSEDEQGVCRICWTSNIKERILRAVVVERALEGVVSK